MLLFNIYLNDKFIATDEYHYFSDHLDLSAEEIQTLHHYGQYTDPSNGDYYQVRAK